MGGNETDDDPQAPAVATDNEAEGSGAAGVPSQHMQVSTSLPLAPSHQRRLGYIVTQPNCNCNSSDASEAFQPSS